ncbi:dienelactone hydrolase family protein [Thioclava atlantica]|uniref:Phosphoribosyltransferase n=1 Tax=Thioclava atlantica TaxID=1317124 RepID=A0A085U0J4_9RHOB|nr:dienelactone hydrolase family protein [Thioclava atlantica]KFE36491.1 phosphoribosyltransferase [Thioclava atlantica]
MENHRTIPIKIPVTDLETPLPGDLTVSGTDTGLVIFAHGSGSSRMSPRNRAVARALAQAGLATLLFDLLTEPEAADRANVFDIPLLAGRVADAVAWALGDPRLSGLTIGLFGSSTGAAAALVAAARLAEDVGAVVSRGGRPDLAGDALEQVTAPTLLIVGGADHAVIDLNRAAYAHLQCEKRLDIVPGATHLFEEPGTLETVMDLAANWFTDHLGRRR